MIAITRTLNLLNCIKLIWLLDSHCACRAYVAMSFECGASSSSRKMLSCHKCCASVELTLSQKELWKFSRLIQFREFILPKSSLKGLACEQLANGMDDQWSHHTSYLASVSSTQYSMKKSKKQVQGHQPHQPQGVACSAGLSEKEIERRRKIGAANKGQVPWTKGRKWSEGMVNLSLKSFLPVVLRLDDVSCHFFFTE